METQPNHLQIHLNVLADQLRGEISSDLTTLKVLNDAIDRNLYPSSNYTLQQWILTTSITVPPLDFLKQREINKCFKSIIGSLQDYLDKLIAALDLAMEDIILPVESNSIDLNKIIESKYEANLLKVSTDQSLKIPKKLEMLLPSPENEEIKNSLQSFFDVRNWLEHHKGIAKNHRVMTYKRIGIVSISGQEIIPKMKLLAGDGICIKAFTENIYYDKGGNIIISNEQLDWIVFSLLLFAIPSLLSETASRINWNT